ncbi:hypothetical protein [Prevotella sp. OH937_COT-195]|uniref:hypothetical protein n=1 Tax=Prevotella sp. OH937_COT-195 TaxID=2491051 RepID=UPI000F651E53|nr:hypothetical protein [Prevotella sp. OH937_COT-195]RRC97665.1 hypothetical protein EII32_10245 [Prevotella sp. OH937_COT-195]
MEKKILKSLYMAFSMSIILLSAGCSHDTDEPNSPTKPDTGQEITLQVSMGEDKRPINDPARRVKYNDDKVDYQQNTLLWEANDKLKVVGMDGDTYKGESVFTLSEGSGTKTAQFTGMSVPGATSYKVYYPSNVTINPADGTATINMDGQVQTGDDNTDHLKNRIFLEGTRNSTSENITMTMKSCIMKLDFFHVPAEVGNLKKILFVVGNKPKNDAAPVTYRYMRELKFTDNSVKFSSQKEDLKAYFAFMPEELQLQKQDVIHIILWGDQKYQTTTSIGDLIPQTYDAGKRYTAKMNYFFKFRSPLEYAAKRNLAQNGTEFAATDANDVSGFFTRSEAENLFTENYGYPESPKYIEIADTNYIYPDAKQWCSIIPELKEAPNNKLIISFDGGDPINDYSEEVKVGQLLIKTKNDYRYSSQDHVIYALRFKGWPDLWRTAWRYRLTENPEPYTLQAGETKPEKNLCLVIETIYIGPFDNTTIDQIARPEFWNGKTTIKRIFPYSGFLYKSNDPIPHFNSRMGESGYWWVNTKYYNVYSHIHNAYTVRKSNWDKSGKNMISVRPFYEEIL